VGRTAPARVLAEETMLIRAITWMIKAKLLVKALKIIKPWK
jgi:hypothetical protein